MARHTKWSVIKAAKMPPAEAARLLAEANAKLDAALPPGWFRGSASWDERLGQWSVAFGATVRTARLELGLTQERLAEGAGLHTTYISDGERGRRNIGLINIDRLARALATDLTALISEVEAARGR